jgi:LuxR family transcriptional regulator, maltose regulon positive regulatory protein
MAIAAPATLLTTKLHRPPVARDPVSRPRLIDALDRGLAKPITLVSAAAGFGKTTLVSAWIESLAAAGSAARAAWLSLDEHDSDLRVFLSYIVAALHTVFPDACPETSALVRAASSADVSVYVAALANELTALPERVVLVLDDYNTIRGRDVHELLQGLIRHWPEPLHLVIVTRNDPPLPLPALRARGLLTEIRSRDLRFSSRETALYLEQAVSEPLEPRVVALVEQRTEGWIAGLYLAALSLRAAGGADSVLAALGDAETDATAYLVDEVLSQQPPAILAFLLRTSLLERFSAPLCEAAVEVSDSKWPARRCLQWIERAGLFVVPLDDRGNWYRYHQLFRELLARRAAAELSAAECDELHRRAARHCAEHGLVAPALRHFLAASDLEGAGALLENALPSVLNGEDVNTLERWLRLLPEELIEHRPGLLLVRAWVLQLRWQLRAQAHVLDEIQSLLDTPDNTTSDDIASQRGQVLTLRAQAAFFRNQVSVAVSHCVEALALLPASHLYCRGGVRMYQGLSMQADGQGDGAERLLLDELALLDDKSNAYGLRLSLALCLVYLQMGALEPCARMARSLVQGASQAGLVISESWGHYFLGVAHYHWDEIDDAQRQFGWVVDHCHVANAFCARNGFMGLALCRQVTGEPQAARRALDLMAEFEMGVRGIESDRARSMRARLMVMDGNVTGAARWADSFVVPPDDTPLIWLDEPQVTRARVLVTAGRDADLRSALDLLDALQDVAERTHNTRYLIELLALRALALDAQGRADDAAAALLRAIALSVPGGFLRVFVDLGDAMRQLLERVVGRDASGAVRRILGAFPLAPDVGAAGAPGRDSDGRPTAGARADGATGAAGRRSDAGVEALTPREREILALLREPLSPKEIAHRLGISHLTVKRHTANLYGKLDATSRWEAVAAAEGRGLLPSR